MFLVLFSPQVLTNTTLPPPTFSHNLKHSIRASTKKFTLIWHVLRTLIISSLYLMLLQTLSLPTIYVGVALTGITRWIFISMDFIHHPTHPVWLYISPTWVPVVADPTVLAILVEGNQQRESNQCFYIDHILNWPFPADAGDKQWLSLYAVFNTVVVYIYHVMRLSLSSLMGQTVIMPVVDAVNNTESKAKSQFAANGQLRIYSLFIANFNPTVYKKQCCIVNSSSCICLL